MPPIEHKAYATCTDTGKTYDLALNESKGERPQIWELDVVVQVVDCRGHKPGCTHHLLTICVERQTLVDLKMLPICHTDQEPPPEAKEKTSEELFLEFLERIGIYPRE